MQLVVSARNRAQIVSYTCTELLLNIERPCHRSQMYEIRETGGHHALIRQLNKHCS